MLNILINAYAVAPNWGSEQGMGWNWVTNIAKFCNVFVITEGEWRKEIEEAVEKLPQKDNIHFYYNPISDRIRRMCWNQGDWRFYWYYHKWQKSTLRIARQICVEQKIDIIHQLNMIGFREPGYLWKIKGPSFFWGPIGGIEATSIRFLHHQNLFTGGKILLKNVLTKIQLNFAPRVKKALKRSDVVLAATNGGYRLLEKFHCKKLLCVNETGLYPLNDNVLQKTQSGLNLLWVGKLDYRKQLHLAIETMAHLADEKDIKLHIVGLNKNNEIHIQSFATSIGVSSKLVWHGRISHDEVQQLMQTSDLFFFTSIHEGTPHVILEAIQNNLPVVCFDVCGQGDVVTECIGRKIKMSDYNSAIKDFASTIEFLYDNRTELHNMSVNCHFVKASLSWENKILNIVKLYKESMESKCPYNK